MSNFLNLNFPEKFDKQAVVIFFVAAISLIGNYYFASFYKLLSILKTIGAENLANKLEILRQSVTNRQFFDLAFWVVVLITNYLFLPAIIARQFGFSFKTLGVNFNALRFSSLKTYLYLYMIMLPLIYLVAQTPSFLQKYPFYKPASDEPLTDYFFWWEILYFLQFVGVEFFFRGFLIHTTKKHFGIYAVLVSLLPYVMIHFGKPLPETFGAIFAGLVLGWLSYRSQSIVPGILLHFTVGLTMDLLAV